MLCYDMCGSLPAARVLGTWKLWPVSASVSGKKKEKGGHCCVNHSGQEEHVWSAHTWSQVTFSRGLI